MPRLAAALLVAMVTTGAALAQPTGHLQGQLVLAPATPVERPGTPSRRGIAGRIQILDARGAVVATAAADPDGRFAADLPPGQYTLHLAAPGHPGRAADQHATLLPGQVTQTQILYDAGIR